MDIAFQLSILLALGMGAQWLSWYLKQPSVLFLLFTGIMIGPVLGWFHPDTVLGSLLFPSISLGVAIILFEGALTLQFHEISQHGRVVQNLVTLGAVITIVVLSLAAYWLFNLDFRVALLFGALVCVTGPTVIAPMLRSVRPRSKIANILRWEGIIIDPVGAIAVVLVYEYIVSDGHENSLLLFSKIVLVAFICGGLGAVFLANAIKRYWLPEYMRNVVTFAFVLILFSVSNYLESQSGLLTVTILGLALANWPQFPRQSILAFNESLTLLFIPTLFIILAARMDVTALLGLGWRGLALLFIAMFIARPLAVWFSSFNSGLSIQEKIMISWIGPRGIVAASIASLFALRLQNQHLSGTELLAPMVFLIIIGTVLIQGLGAKTIAGILKVREPGNNGVLIVGSNEVALMLATTLKQLNIDVLVADYHYVQIARARMKGLRTYFGNPVSENAQTELDLIGIGYLFAVSRDKELNTLCELQFRHDFGEQNIYRIRFNEEQDLTSRAQKQYQYVSRQLFGKDVTFRRLENMLGKQTKIKITNITATYDYHQYCHDHPQAIPLFLQDKNNILYIISSEFQPATAIDKKLIALDYQ